MPTYVKRYSKGERTNHWLVALLFVLAALSGLAFFHPSLFFFSNLFGGGPWTRILHPFIGVAVLLAFIGMFVRFWRANIVTDADRQWRAHMGEMMRGDKYNMPPVGKYNYGQKMVFWLTALSLVALPVTGIVFWRPWFADFFPIGLIRVATLLHAFFAVVAILVVIVHVYAAIWVKGTMRAMTRGTVTEGWARQNHPLWHRELTRGE